MKFVFSPDIILCDWLGSKHQVTNFMKNLRWEWRRSEKERGGEGTAHERSQRNCVYFCTGLLFLEVMSSLGLNRVESDTLQLVSVWVSVWLTADQEWISVVIWLCGWQLIRNEFQLSFGCVVDSWSGMNFGCHLAVCVKDYQDWNNFGCHLAFCLTSVKRHEINLVVIWLYDWWFDQDKINLSCHLVVWLRVIRNEVSCQLAVCLTTEKVWRKLQWSYGCVVNGFLRIKNEIQLPFGCVI